MKINPITIYRLLQVVLVVILLTASLRICCSKYVPFGASIIPFLYFRLPETHTIEHNGRTFNVFFNDGGAVQSGNYWCWIVYSEGWVDYVVAEGYVTAMDISSNKIPVREMDKSLEARFLRRKYGGESGAEVVWKKID